MGRVLLPATAMLEACTAAANTLAGAPGQSGIVLQGFGITGPLIMPATAPMYVEIEVNPQGSMQLFSVQHSMTSKRQLHCSGGVRSRLQRQVLAAEQVALPIASGSLRPSTRAGAWTARSVQSQMAFASIWMSAVSQHGYCLHPAKADAVLHLAGAFATTAGPLLVPVALSALTCHNTGVSYDRWVHPAAFSDLAGAAGSEKASLSYQLQGDLLPALEVAGVTLKSVQSQPAAQASVDSAEQPFNSDIKYCIEWQVSREQPMSSEAAPGRLSAWAASVSTSLILQYNAASAIMPAAVTAAATTGLELLQHSMAAGGNSTCSLQVAGAPSSLPSAGGGSASVLASSSAASLAALCKVAAMESADVTVQSSQLESATILPGEWPTARFCGNDAFGTAGSHGAVLRARLLRSSDVMLAANSHLLPCPRGSLQSLRLVPHAKSTGLLETGQVKASKVEHSWCSELPFLCVARYSCDEVCPTHREALSLSCRLPFGQSDSIFVMC